jgi:hypothetical protein
MAGFLSVFSVVGLFQCHRERKKRSYNVMQQSRMDVERLNDPPEALVALIAWESGEGEVTQVNVWENPRGSRRLLHGADHADRRS